MFLAISNSHSQGRQWSGWLRAACPGSIGCAGYSSLVDGAPVIQCRRVVGHRGGFEGYQFRTMIPEADAMLAADA